MWLSPPIGNPWWQDAVAMGITLALAIAFLKLNNLIAGRGLLPEYVTRKLIHIGTGPLYLLCWPLFSQSWHGRWAAAAVPAGLTGLFALIGLGLVRQDDFVASMSRTGRREELLRGPLQYGLVFVVATLIFWTTSPVGIVLLMLLCGGDGLADVVGRRWGKARLPGQPAKSWAGSLGFVAGGACLSLAYLALFSALGFWSIRFPSILMPVLACTLLAALVEAYTPSDLDNVTVSLASAVFLLLIPGGLLR